MDIFSRIELSAISCKTVLSCSSCFIEESTTTVRIDVLSHRRYSKQKVNFENFVNYTDLYSQRYKFEVFMPLTNLEL